MANIDLIKYIGKVLYPVGSIYITTDYSITTTKLANYFGGSWYKTSTTGGCFFPAAGSSYTAFTGIGSNNGKLLSHSHTTGTTGSSHTHSGKYKQDSSYNDTGDPTWTYNGDGHGTKSGVFLASDGTHSHPTTNAVNSSYTVRGSADNLNRPPYVTVFYFYRTA